MNLVEDARLTSGTQRGDVPEIDSAQIWGEIVRMLEKKDYRYDSGLYGDHQQLCEKIAYFFHASLQGTEAAPKALFTLNALADAGLRQSALANAQCFSLVQLTRALREQGTIQHVGNLFPDSLNTLSYEWGIRKPSASLFAQSILRHKSIGIEANQILHVGTRMKQDLAIAKSCGMKTVLYAADRVSLQAAPEDLKNLETRPDRLINNLSQIRDILQI
jgi:FMN phosphatase YigB (HAD superfamily)